MDAMDSSSHFYVWIFAHKAALARTSHGGPGCTRLGPKVRKHTIIAPCATTNTAIICHNMRREWLRRKVGQVVLVVIDALRADFVLPKSILAEVGMAENEQRIDFLSKLVTENEQELVVNALVARANAPTVTMPRIKVSEFKHDLALTSNVALGLDDWFHSWVRRRRPELRLQKA